MLSTQNSRYLLLGCFILLQAICIKAQVGINTVPGLSRDTVFLCMPSTSVTFSSTFSSTSDSIFWDFTSGTPDSANGAGQHSVNFPGVGNYGARVRYYLNDTIVGSKQVWVDIQQLGPVSFNPSKIVFCQSDAPFTLNGFSPPGGYFKGPGVSGKKFDPDGIGTGNKTVWYVVEKGGCKDSASAMLSVNSSPNTMIQSTGTQTVFQGVTVYTICQGSAPHFTFFSPTPPSQYSSFTLDFGDGSVPLTGSVFPSTVSHTFGAGRFTVTLTMTGSNGCSRSTKIELFHGSNPAVGLNLSGNNEACLKSANDSIGYYFPITGTASNPPGTFYTLIFNDRSKPITYAHPPPDSVFHSFKKGSCGASATTYSNAFQAKIIASNPCASSAATVEPIFISEPARPDFEVLKEACVNKSVHIHDSSYSGSYVNGQNYATCGQTAKVIWSISPPTYTINSGSFGTRLNPTDPSQWFPGSSTLDVTFHKTGIYTIKQVVGSVLACAIDSLEKTICIDSIPLASLRLNRDTVCIGDSITASFKEDILGICDTIGIRWGQSNGSYYDLGVTGIFDTTQNYIFNRVGIYPIRMVAENSCDSVELFDTVVVRGVPTAIFPNDTAICGLATIDFSALHLQPLVFDSLSEVSHNWRVIPATGWSFAGGTSATSPVPQIDFTQYGTYQVIYTVSGICGSTSDTMTVTLNEEPVLQAVYLPFKDTVVCEGTSLTYKATAGLGSPPYQFSWGSWSQNNPSSADSIVLSNLMTDTTIYVKVEDALGCSDSVAFRVNVVPAPTVSAGSATSICALDSVQLNGTVTGGTAPFTYQWSPAAGLSSTTVLNPWRASLDSSITYTLTVTDSLGCVYMDSVTVTVFPKPNFTAGKDFTLCLNQGDTLLSGATPTGGSWSGPGLSGALFSPATAGLGVHVLLYSYTDPHNCLYLDTLLITVIAQPAPNFGMDVSQGCSPLTVTFTDSSGASNGQQWFMNGTPFSTAQNPVQTFTNNFADKDTVIEIKLLFQAGSGCSDSIVKSITVLPKPSAGFMLPSTTCAGDSLQVVNTSIFKPGSVTYHWSASNPGVAIPDTSAASPSFTFPDFNSGTDSVYNICLVVTSVDGCSDTICHNISVRSRPRANFSLPASACAPVSISPLDSSSGNGLNYQWSISPLTNVTLSGLGTASPVFDFTSPSADSTTYSITLAVTDAHGCVDSLSQNYTLYAQPAAGFTLSRNDSCSPFTVNLTNNSHSGLSGAGQVLSFQWDLGNGQTSTDTNLSVIYTNTGLVDSTYHIRLIAQNSLGCADTIYDSVVVHPDPRAEMLFPDSVNCAPFMLDSNAVKAIRYASANSQYQWTLFDMQGGVIQQFTGAGAMNYPMNSGGDSVLVQLVATSPFGCKADTATQLFYTIVNPQPDFVAFPDSICSGGTVLFQDSSTAGVSHEWFINGSLFSTNSNPTLTLVNSSFTRDSTVVIKLRTKAGSTGCADSISKTVVVHPAPDAQFTLPARLCANDSVQPVNGSLFGGSPTYRWRVSSPAVRISDTTLAQPWFHFPDNQSGVDSTYSIELIVTNSFGCSDTIEQNITINNRPVAAFTLPGNGCGPLSFTPANVPAGQGFTYQWSVVPATGVTTSGLNTASPQFSFVSPLQDSARYLIKLTLTDANGCTDTLTQTFDVYPKPTAGFIASNADSCGPHTVNFSNTSLSNITGQGRTTMSFDWDFGNGQTSQDSTPVMTFTNSGVVDSTYTVRLIASNSLGCSDTVSVFITVRPNPSAEMDTSTTFGCTPLTINDSVVKAMVYPVANASYQWSVLNPKTMAVIQSFTGPNALNYQMLNSGDTVLIRLITTSPHGCKADTVEQLFRTIPNPEPGFGFNTNQGCHPLTVNITDTSTGVTSYAWYINGQLQTTTLANPIFTLTNTSLTADSTYIIKLLGTAGTGCVDSIQDTVTVFALPDPSFSANEVCGGDTTIFTNTTSTIDTIVSWHWDFGDATSSHLKDPAHAYTAFGTYPVTLMATDSRGCSQTFTDTITVRPNPVADFSASKSCGPDTACMGRPFSFTDLSSVAALGGNITSWEWDILNDGTVEYTTQNPQHTFTTSGVFDIKLSVQTQYGCRGSVVRQIQVLDAITANFFTDTTATCGPLNIVATDSSTGPVAQYFWELYSLDSLGNPNPVFFTSAQQNPNPIPTLLPSYLDDTTYVLKLTVSNCCDTVSHEQRFVLKPLPAAGLVALPPSGCSGFKVDFVIDGNTTGRPDSVILSFGDGTPQQIYTPSPVFYRGDTIYVFGKKSHVFVNTTNKDTTYYVTLKAKNQCGDSTVQIPILVHPNIVQASFSYTPAQGCEDLTVNFTDGSFGGNTYAWSFDFDSLSTTGNHFSDSGKVASHTYTDPGTYLVAYIVSDGCSNDTAYTTITVYDAPETEFTHTNNTCEGDSVFFTNQTVWSPNSIGFYRWYFGNGDSSSQKDPVHIYDSSGVFTVWLKSFSPNGCVDSISHQVTIHDGPNVNFSVNNACLGDTLIFYDSTTVQNATINRTTWRIDTIGTYFNNPSPFVISKAGSYQVTLIKESSQGCVDSLTKTLNIFEVPQAGFSVKRDTTVDSCGNISAYIFRDSSISSSPLQYFWDFDLANAGTKTSNLKNPGSIVYSDTGYFYISLTVWNADSCYDIFHDTLFVKPKSRVNFSPMVPEACMFDTIHFHDSTRYRSGSGNNVLTYLWDFGDGTTSTAKNPRHAYNLAGTYTVKLKVWDPSCVDSLSRQVVIHQTPVAEIVPGQYELCSRNEIEFYSGTLMSFPNGDVVDSLIWMISDGREISRFQDSMVSIYFAQPGLYTIGLVAITDKGCRDTADTQINITVHPTPVVVLEGESINARTFRFMPDVMDAVNASHYWDFGNGDSRVSEKPDTIPYRYTDRLCRIDSAIHRSVSLTVINQIENFGQCMDADTIDIIMEGYHLNVPNAFAPERNNVEDANVFLPKGRLLGKYRLRIYDEWGNLIFENEELTPEGTPAVGWNGMYNGELLPTGAYVWTIDAEFNDGYGWPVKECNTDNRIKAYGTVTLIR